MTFKYWKADVVFCVDGLTARKIRILFIMSIIENAHITTKQKWVYSLVLENNRDLKINIYVNMITTKVLKSKMKVNSEYLINTNKCIL